MKASNVDRIRSVYGLCLAIQGEPRDVRALPWFSRWEALANAELRALRADNVTLADSHLAARQAHEKLLAS